MEREIEPHPSVSPRHHIEVGQALTIAMLVPILGACLFTVVGMFASLKPPYPNALFSLWWRASFGAFLCTSIALGVTGVFNTFFKPEALGERSLARIPPATRRHLRLYGIAEVWASAWTIKLFIPLLVANPLARIAAPTLQSLVIPSVIAVFPLAALRIFVR